MINYVVAILAFLSLSSSFALPLIEFSQQAQKFTVSQSALSANFQIKNNTPRPLDFTAQFSGVDNATVSNDCNSRLPASGNCNLTVNIIPGAKAGHLNGTLSVDYGYRGPLTATIGYDAVCQLLPVFQYQSNFCQQQLANVIANTQGVFNVSNQNVVKNQRLGGVFGSYQANQQCYISCGYSDLSKSSSPTEQSIFEMASLTKTVTGLILALRHYQGHINPTDTVAADLPPNFSLTANAATMTYQQLATFSAGFYYSDPPTTPYTQANFEHDVSQLDPANAASTPVYNGVFLPSLNIYSNSSYGLLGQILAYNAYPAVSFGPAVLNAIYCNNVFNILQMNQINSCTPSTTSSGQCLSTGNSCNSQGTWQQSMQFTPGFKVSNGQFVNVAYFPWRPWGAAGALRANAEELVKFLKLHLGHTDGSQAQADLYQAALIALTANNYLPVPGGQTVQANHPSVNSPNLQAYAWIIKPPPTPNPNNQSTIYFKDGAHQGFNTWLGLNSAKDYGIVILFNTGPANLSGEQFISSVPSIDNIGINIIRQTPHP